ncbi:hypothetical protein M2475_002199 [Breznakia sp. PF5-3]|uniref:hypothetical protein n=1 Tax=unclassified Breznakia TaxID=2623764 RepID=UPI002404BC79|nr:MULTISPECIES: hypothetical protein [unclassified Breznakia]MDL2276728.1 hypothetical protein [Breznakia sp. OttesenSCG-928-G09]MDF9825813.1 hypothetical protein [Breznakia sp. PM6-1]MDF9836618.1 hypothetical protein [Breznakia sp. PF5-3]MDF9838859.1 hypothetical protein [Breznakia sp. PFB2-8]MDF9860885.1 hypothetical protein [Breznakia sp. PH5-24]
MNEDFIANNLPLFLGVFGTVCVGLVVLMIVSGKKQKQKKKEMLESDPNLVEVVFDYPVLPKEKVLMNPGQSEFVIHSINRNPGKVIRNSILVPAGEVELDLEYYQKMATSKLAKSLARSTNVFKVEMGKKYLISYNLIDKVFECSETKRK